MPLVACAPFFFSLFAFTHGIFMLTLEHVYSSYTGHAPYILENLSMHVAHGAYISVIGENGCGKTTLIRLIAGFLVPVSGRIVRATDNFRYVPQKNDTAYSGFPITVGEILHSYRKLLGIKGRASVDDALAQTGMTFASNKLIGTLSGGQVQRVAIARALIGEPELLILDEPSTGIDRNGRREIYELLKALNIERGMTILSVDHNLEAALAYSTGIYHLSEGHGHLCTPEQYATELLAPKEAPHAAI